MGGLGVLRCAEKRLRWGNHSSPATAITQARNTSAIIAACSAWVLGNRAGLLGSGDETFSSGVTLALPGFRASFVLRDRCHSKGETVSVSNVSSGVAKGDALQRP